MSNMNHTRTLNINYDDGSFEEDYCRSEWTIRAIERLEELSQALQRTIKSKDSKIFLRVCDEADSTIKAINDSGLKRTVAKLKAHFKNEIKLNDFSFRQNTARLQAIGSMLIEAMLGNGLAA